MRRSSITVLAVVSMLVCLPLGARAQPRSAAASCPGYGAQLRTARDHLAHGDRVRALAALQKARQALRLCLHGGTATRTEIVAPASRDGGAWG
jgi:hypothetical protein